ncbi:hypothetical protein C0Q70_19181 [Pomacea canaliculata]|uniref:Uncharacterized protein n=1 Tax=Pomacea canaliculata TaxID=400727 RepID=A0A2T7NIN0_POMCA|nr:hypothetical protein C0Q70_19181 [Pomacea canaliculata]
MARVAWGMEVGVGCLGKTKGFGVCVGVGCQWKACGRGRGRLRGRVALTPNEARTHLTVAECGFICKFLSLGVTASIFISVGSIVIVVSCIVALVCCCRRQLCRKRPDSTTTSVTTTATTVMSNGTPASTFHGEGDGEHRGNATSLEQAVAAVVPDSRIRALMQACLQCRVATVPQNNKKKDKSCRTSGSNILQISACPLLIVSRVKRKVSLTVGRSVDPEGQLVVGYMLRSR